MDHRRLVPGLIAVALTVGAGLWYSSSPPAPPPATVIVAADPAKDAGPLTVHVTGLVARPGLVSVPEGSRVADVVAAAGGAVAGADLQRLNLAAPVADGQHLAVPATGSGGLTPASPESTGVAINRAGPDELQDLPGVGPVLAARIVAYRDENGPFRVLEDLLDVPGIGEAKLAAIREEAVLP